MGATIYLLRHATSMANKMRLYGTDLPLTFEGITACRKKSQDLNDALSPDMVYSSTKIRAIKTAELCFGENVYKGTLPEFDEIFFGTLEGTEIGNKEVSPVRTSPSDLPRLCGGDNVYYRAIIAIEKLEELAELFPEKRIVIVTHDTLMQAIMALLDHGEIEGHIWTGEYRFGHLEYVKLDMPR